MHQYVIFDLDGTLALDAHRAHHIQRPVGERDWEAYFNACAEDELNWRVAELAGMYRNRDLKIVIFTGRVSRVRDITEKWLWDNCITYDLMFMRPDDNRVDDHILKVEWGRALGLHNIRVVFEDRQRVVDAWRAAGVFVLQTAKGDF